MKDYSVDTAVLPAPRKSIGPVFGDLKLLIACSSCWKDLPSNQVIRETWAKYIPENWDLRFFLGDRNFTDEEQAELFTPAMIGSPGTLGNLAPETAKKAIIGDAADLKADEILVPTPDSYLGLPWKTVESLKWALEKGYDGILRIFVDTYLFADRLAAAPLQGRKALGWSFGCGPCPAHPGSYHSCPLGGSGYFLDSESARVVLGEPIRHWGEDTHVGFALQKGKIKLDHDFRFVYDESLPPEFNRSKFSIHLNDRGTPWYPAKMRDTHFAQEFGRKKWPDWNGTCDVDGTSVTIAHPRGPRCRQCGKFVAGL